MFDTLIQPGDKVFVAFPADLHRAAEDIAEQLDATYPGVDFEVVVSGHIPTARIIFIYRDPAEFQRWLDEAGQKKAEEQGFGLFPDPPGRGDGTRW